jgi:hypothetical protein
VQIFSKQNERQNIASVDFSSNKMKDKHCECRYFFKLKMKDKNCECGEKKWKTKTLQVGILL